jgi:hypothetical protein
MQSAVRSVFAVAARVWIVIIDGSWRIVHASEGHSRNATLHNNSFRLNCAALTVTSSADPNQKKAWSATRLGLRFSRDRGSPRSQARLHREVSVLMRAVPSPGKLGGTSSLPRAADRQGSAAPFFCLVLRAKRCAAPARFFRVGAAHRSAQRLSSDYGVTTQACAAPSVSKSVRSSVSGS